MGQLAEGRRIALSAEIADLVREDILSGQLRSGERIRLEPLAEKFGVSTLPVREALRQLTVEGLVDFHPHRGAVVAPLLREELQDLWEVQAFASGLAVERAVARLTEADLRTLAEALDEIERGQVDAERLNTLNHGVHRLLNRLSGSRKLVWLLGLLNRYVPHTFYQFVADWPAISQADHRRLYQALSRRDGPAARAIMQAHVAQAGRLLLDYLDRRGFWQLADAGVDPVEPDAAPAKL